MKDTHIARFIYLLIMLFISAPLVASHYYFKKISLEDGLPSTIRCIFTEEKGFVWIGTKSGLGRFDGHELKRYSHETNNPNSLPHNHIHKITEDEQHNVWVLTDKGIARYQRNSDDFYIPKDKNGNNIIVYSSCQTSDGIIFGGRNQIYKYEYANNSLHLIQEFKSSPFFAITAISFWSTDTLLCCSRWMGMRLVNIHTGKLSASPLDCGNEIMKMIVDSKQRIWIAPYNNGVRCYARSGKLLASYTTQNSELNNNVVLSIAERDNKIWIGTDGGGINILDPETRNIRVLEHKPGDKYSLPVNSILSLYNDSNNNMWAGTIRSGLVNIREVSMKTYTEVLPGSNEGLSNNTILSLFQDNENRQLWIGTDGGGINCLNPDTRKFKHFPSTQKDKIASISGFTANELLISVFARGIFIFNKSTGAHKPLIIINEEINNKLCSNGKAVNLYQNNPNNILLLADHVYQYNISTRQFSIAAEEEGTELTGTVNPVAHNEKYTYINDSRRIYALDQQTNKLKTLLTLAQDTIINSVSLDEHGVFWIGSQYGLSSFNPQTGAYEHIETPLFNKVNSVVCDLKGKVWIGTDGMLFSRLIKEERFILFGESDGAILNEYMFKPRWITAEGDVYMGGINGLLCIDHDLSIDTSETPQLQLTGILVNGEPINNEQVEDPTNITVPWNNTRITIRFMSRERDIFRKKIYRYHIAGLDEQDVDSYNPELILRSLPPGTYHIHASCTTLSGDWTPPQQILTITVLPPWYKSWWFILCCILLIAGSIIACFIFTLRRKENKLKWTMKEHEQQVYEEKVRFLINISHELRTPLTLIHAPLSRILKTLARTDNNYLPLKGIFRQSQRMKDLLNMVLDVRKMEVGESKLHIHPQSLNEWIQCVSQDFISEGEAHDIRICFQPDSRIGEVSFDKDKCEIILNNLLINALKHSPEHTEITVATEMFTNEQKVRISVIDQGCGLKQIDTKKLFTRFYQGSNEQNGSGIGLSYSKILAELHGGSMGARDNENTGATFYFELPLSNENIELTCPAKAYLNELIADPIDVENQTASRSFNTGKYSILVVDDNTDLLEFLQDALSGHFREIYTATDGEKALETIQKRQPDIVVSDVMMPRMNGYELCKRMKEDINISHIPVILLTARDDQQSQLDGYKNGADAYLTKPFEIEVLLELLRNRLHNREETKTRYMNAGLLSPEETTFSQADETFLMKMNKVIMDNLDNTELDVMFLCKEIGMSRASLYNKLKAITNMGANDYINKFRMEKAISLISTTDLTVTEVAEKVGFTTSRYFSTAFKQYTGQTPTQYKTSVRSPQ